METSPERPVITVDQVFAIAGQLIPRFRVLVLLACFGCLRWGELAALARRHVNPETGTVRVERTVVELTDGSLVFGPPKSEAGKRTITLPTAIHSAVLEHLAEFVEPNPDALLFTGPKGAPLRRANFQKNWAEAIKASGVDGLHFHDLRHTGNTLASELGAGLRDLMDRMGHSTTRAAKIYLHKTVGRDQTIADALNNLIEHSQNAAADNEQSNHENA